MLRHLEANKELEAPVQIKMLTILSFEDSCKEIVKSKIGKFGCL